MTQTDYPGPDVDPEPPFDPDLAPDDLPQGADGEPVNPDPDPEDE